MEKNKIRVGVLTNPPSPATDCYRGVGAFDYMDGVFVADGREIQVYYIHPDELMKMGALWFKMFRVDWIIVQRPNGVILNLLAEARRMGKRIIADIDDHLLWLPKGNPAREHFNRPDVQQSVYQSLQFCEGVIYSTDKLSELFSSMTTHAKTVVIPNGLNDHLYEFEEIDSTQSQPINFIWRGSSTHLMDIFEVRQVLEHLRSSGKSNLTYYGYENPFDPSEGGYQYKKWAGSFFSYMDMLKADKPDWMLVPLQKNDFNLSKSNIAWIEAAYAGAAVLAPAGFPEFEQKGVLNYDNPQHLEELVKGIEAREIVKEEYVSQSRETIHKNYLLSEQNKKRLDFINSLVCQKVTV